MGRCFTKVFVLVMVVMMVSTMVGTGECAVRYETQYQFDRNQWPDPEKLQTESESSTDENKKTTAERGLFLKSFEEKHLLKPQESNLVQASVDRIEQVLKQETPPSSDEVAAPTPSTDKSVSREKIAATEKPTQGRGLKIVAEGDDLVVYDAEGKEVLRMNRESKTTSKPKVVQPAQKSSSGADASAPSIRSAQTPVFEVLKKGENPSIIAQRYRNLTAEDILRANQIDDPRSLPVGTKLWIPTFNGLAHKVQQGETLSRLLRQYNIGNLYEVCDINGLPRTQNSLKEGTVLVLPGADRRPQIASKTVEPIQRKPVNTKVSWQWPVKVDAPISSPYGLRNDPFGKKNAAGGGKANRKRSMHHGIDIAVPVGTKLHAVRAGEVVQVSSSRYGYGRMIKVRDHEGMYQIYAHCSKILKKEGDKVKQDEVIALSGNTGRSTGPHLHFEIRRPDQKTVNPLSYLKKP